MTLFVVSTPIGNLDDLSSRARRILSEVDLIVAEDTRRSSILLSRWGITTSMIPLHEYNERSTLPDLIERLKAGKKIALVSDAGTPLISDPGYILVRECGGLGIAVSPIPGPCSVIAALSVAGLPTDQFVFRGFLPPKKNERRSLLISLASKNITQVFFEVPHRIASTISEMKEIMPGREITICRELTKNFEQVVLSTVEEIDSMLMAGEIPLKGEFVLLIRGTQAQKNYDEDRLLNILLKEMSPSRAASVVSKFLSLPKANFYDKALTLKRNLELEN